VLQWLSDNSVDVLTLQETKCVDDQFPVDAIEQAGYHVVYAGQKTYNGMAVIARHAMHDIVKDMPTFSDPQRRMIAVTVNDVRVINLYAPNGQAVDSDKYQYKLDWLDHMKNYLKQELSTHSKMIVLGDFNIAPDDRDVHDPKAWEGHVLVSPKEREALQAILGLGFYDSFRLFEKEGGFYSWWDYRMGAFRRNMGLRIDLILVSEALKSACISSEIDKIPREWERPSDHAPVVVTIKNGQ